MHASKAHRVHSPLSPSNIGSGCITPLITHILVISRARISCLGTLDEAERAVFSVRSQLRMNYHSYHSQFSHFPNLDLLPRSAGRGRVCGLFSKEPA
jgi:hypothetical protein